MLGKLFEKAKNGLKKISKVGKVLVATLALGSILLPLSQSAVAQPGEMTTQSLTPRFNFLQGDVEMLRESPKSPAGWTDPVTVNNNEQVAFLMYFHNGVLNTTAHNTKLRVDLPNDAGTNLQMTSYLWSDETANITNTVVNGQIVGNSGGTINVTSPARIRYVPGSTRIYRNGSQTGVALADGITSSAGINIGDVQGCWQYSGYVTFLGELFGNSKMTIEKQVAHPGNPWVKQINAAPGDTVSYLLALRNDGDLTAPTVKVTDQLATYTSYIPGTTYLYTDPIHPDAGLKQADTLTTSGLNVTNINPGEAGVVYLKFKAKVDTSIPAGTWGLVNVASVFVGSVLQDRDEAKLIVVSNSKLDLDKRVYDPITRNWEKISNAGIGDIRTFRIVIKNSGNTPLANVKVRDVLPVFTILNSAITLNGQNMTVAQQTQFLSGSLNLGTLQPGCETVITFQVLTIGCPPLGETLITNTAYSSADNALEVISSAQIRINMSAPVNPVIH